MLSDKNVLEVTNLQDEEASQACGTPLLHFLLLIHSAFALLDQALPCIPAQPTHFTAGREASVPVSHRLKLSRVWITQQGEIQG